MTHVSPIAHLDTFAFLASLYARREAFNDETRRQLYPGSPHRDTRAIFLRGPEQPTPARWFEDVPHVDYPALADWPEATAVLAEIGWHLPFGAVLGKAMIVELKSEGAIAWHTDEGPYAERYERFHLPLTTNPEAFLLSGGEQVHVPVGLLIRFDNRVLHSAVNGGRTPRIHLIVDGRKDGA